MNKNETNLLINELEENPAKFFDEGRSYDLLQEYFRGFPVESLGQLLKHRNLHVKRIAIWITSELGDKAASIAENILPLLKEEDRYVKYHALESVMALSSSVKIDLFHHLIQALESDDNIIRKLAMYLISNASRAQLQSAKEYYTKVNNNLYVEGLVFLINESERSESCIEKMLLSENEILPRFGAIFLRRSAKDIDRQKIISLNKINDTSIKMFWKEFIKEQ